MIATEKFTLLVPTKDRPALLNGLLNYLSSKSTQFQIVVVDSSSPDNKELNRRSIEKKHLNVRHIDFHDAAMVISKINAAMANVYTEYVGFCGDDDLVFVDAIEDSVRELDRTSDFIACHGTYLNFRLSPEESDLFIEYASPSLDASDLLGRIYQLLSNYEAIFYAVYRTNLIKSILIESEQIRSPHFWELFTGLAALAGGKVKRLPVVSHARRSFVPAPEVRWHPVPLIFEDPDAFISDFLDYRKRLFGFFTSQGIAVGPELARQITRAHLVYFVNSLGDGSWLRELIARDFAKIGVQSVKYDKPGGPHTEKLKLIRDGVEFQLSKSTRRIIPHDVALDLSNYCKIIMDSSQLS
jgi:glycosyltransferase domain-containing protein